MKCKQTLFLALTVALLTASIISTFASVTIPKRPIFFPFNNGAYLTFSTAILPLTFSGNPQSVYRDTVNRWHFGTTWITSTTDVTITAWFSGDWLNYTVPSSGTQQISNGSKPTAVFLDDVNKTEGDGWSYSGTTVTVTGATTSASLYWGSGGTPSVTVTIVSPTNTTYTTSTVSIQLSASGGTIDTIWWNCKNGTSWIYGTNQTYTTPTSMTGFVNGTSYTFYAWANNTDGEWDEETVMFTVEIESAPPASVTLVITSPANTTYTSSTITISLSASGGTIDKIWWNIQFENASWLYAENQTYTVATSVVIDENVTATFYGYANNTDGNSDDGSVVFTVYIVSNTIGYQLSQGTIAAAGMLGIIMLLGMVYVALEGKDTKYAVMLAIGEVLLLVTMLVLSQLSILG